MNAALRLRLIVVLLCICLFVVTLPAHADGIVSGKQVAGIFIAIIAVGAVIGVAIYYVARRPPSLTGCATTSPAGLSLQNESDQQAYTLIGDTAGIKVGDRIHISGKKKKQAATHDFIVEKLAKDFGPCKVSPATP